MPYSLFLTNLATLHCTPSCALATKQRRYFPSTLLSFCTTYVYFVFQLFSALLDPLHGLLLLGRAAPGILASTQGIAPGARSGRAVGSAAVRCWALSGEVLGTAALLSQCHVCFVPRRERVSRRAVGQRAQVHHIHSHLEMSRSAN